MPAMAHEITRDDLMPMADYGAIRKQKRLELRPIKKSRQIAVGPYATFYFENYETMWHQVHEMLFIEKGGEAQIKDELSAYNPLIPQGQELVCTLMFEIADETRRNVVLRTLTHIEEFAWFQIGDEKVPADWENDVDRTASDGKTSAVHFLRFHFTPDQIAAFDDPSIQTMIGFSHENYGHMAIVSDDARAALAKDFG